MGDRTFYVNTNIQKIHSYSTKINSFQRNNNQYGLIPISIYEDMNDHSRSAWKEIDFDIRSRITKQLKSSDEAQQKQSSTQQNRNNNRQRLNLRNITLHDLLTNYHV